MATVPAYQIEIQYPYSFIIHERREAASHISVLSIIPHSLSSSEYRVEGEHRITTPTTQSLLEHVTYTIDRNSFAHANNSGVPPVCQNKTV